MEEVLAKISGYKIDNIINNGVLVITSDGIPIIIPLEHLNASRVSYPDNCFSLSLSKAQCKRVTAL